MIPLLHQMQPTNNSCTSACLAMITNRPVRKIMEEFHDKWQVFDTNPLKWLEANTRLKCKALDIYYDTVFNNAVYLATVPSLNIEGGLHHILFDTRGEHCVVYDPAMGRGKYYGNTDLNDDPLCVNLMCWTLDLEIMCDEDGGFLYEN